MSNPNLIIDTPRGQIVTVKTKNGNVTAKLAWKAGYGEKKTNDFTRAQKFLDSEVLRTSAPFVPFRTGALERSGQLGTVIGSGMVTYNAPYARKQYWNTALSRPYDAQRGAKWFERAKIQHKSEWLNGVKKLSGG